MASLRSAQPELHHRRLNAVSAKGFCVLDAVGASLDGEAETGFWVFLSHGSELSDLASVGVNAIVERQVPLRGNTGALALCTRTGPDAPALVLHSGGPLPLEVAAPEPELLEGRNCLLAVVNIDDAAQVVHWAEWHARAHGVTGVLLYNRLGPDGQGSDLVAAFQAARALGGVRVVIVDVPVPVGRAGLPSAQHKFNAPDAPGKDRMDVPDPDPWRAPLADEALIEAARWRFLRRARGVSFLDMFDYLSPLGGEGNVFDRAAAAPGHLITLGGARVYPWQVRKGAHPVPGDHICAPFDIRTSFSRWCMAASLTDGAEQVWRPHRVIGVTSTAVAQPKVLRMMAMRHPDHAPAEIAPKSSLMESADLVRLATEGFGHKPRRAPKPEEADRPVAAVAAPAPDAPPRITIVTAMKNEGPFLLEWIAYHRAIGVTDFVVYTNDCTDGTDTFLQLLQRKGILQHRENPFRQRPGLKPQHAALEAAQSEPVVENADWLLASDVDEFIAVHVGDGTLAALFEAVGEANLISLTWRLFGNSGLRDYEDAFITRQFTECAWQSANKPHQAWGFKTLFKNNGIFKKLGVHRPKGLRTELMPEIRWVNGSGKSLPHTEFRNAWRSNAATVGYDLATLNHYAVRSVESFLVKRDRGRVNHTDRDQGLAYWFRMNHNSTQDPSIQRMIPALQAEWDRLTADEEIRAAHEGCVAAHRAKIAELKARPDYAAFFEEISSPRMLELSRRLKHFGRNVFLAGPSAIPDWVVETELADDFFFTVDRPEEVDH